uniref:GMPS ATP-PPase domain-containing protein n=1 Tax=Timema douglasi TaxID=61478 RepID=A0A7R8VEB3_TIMDO|nr:unnamed protein product [Timema douglasi]
MLLLSSVVTATHQFLLGTTTVPMDTSSRTRITKMLCMTCNPEEKRKIIGDVFVKVANEVITELNLKPEEVFLGQGTLRPDLIESASHLASNKADVIKTHHNDSLLVRKLRDEGRVVEPLKDFHKDEVIDDRCSTTELYTTKILSQQYYIWKKSVELQLAPNCDANFRIPETRKRLHRLKDTRHTDDKHPYENRGETDVPRMAHYKAHQRRTFIREPR